MTGKRIARIGLVGASLLAAPLVTGAQAEEEGMFVKNLLGSMGIIPEEKEPIEYRERAPLVMPPRMALPEPAAPGSSQAANPQWPNDPDVAARKQREAEARQPVGESELRRMNDGHARLSVQEMRALSRRPRGGAPAEAPSENKAGWVNPDVLRAQSKLASEQAGPDTEIARRSLTDPPSAYTRSATGQAIKGSFDVPEVVNEADPRAFLRQQQQRR